MSNTNSEPFDNNKIVENLKGEILRIWKKEREPEFYPLSKLGSELGPDLKNIRDTTGMKLAQFIEAHLSDRFRVLNYGEKGTLRAIVAVGSDLNSDNMPPSNPAQTSIQRFNRALWAAFLVPIARESRFFNFKRLSFRDVDFADSVVEGDELVIPGTEIVGANVPDRIGQIEKNITAWLQQNNLNIDDFIQIEPQKSNNLLKNSAGNTTALDVLISSLNPVQLKSTTLSLDVVASLAARVI